MDNNTPPAAASQGTDANPNINSNDNPESGSSQPQLQQSGPDPQTPEVDELDKFIEVNGGRAKVLEKMKQAIGNPEEYARNILKKFDNQGSGTQSTGSQVGAQQSTPAPTSQSMLQSQKEVLAGGISIEEFMTKQYFDSMAGLEEFAGIKDQIKNGEVLKEMAKFNIKPMIDGQFNHKQVKDFLDLYAKTVQPKAPEAPLTTTPTIDYQEVEGEVDSQEKAFMIMRQGESHPQYNKALEFLRK